ncbi:hypothetical protein BH10PLA1_BH10PLA1_15930 [soil metagenome]
MSEASFNPPLIEPHGQTYGSVTDQIIGVTQRPIERRWLMLIGLFLSGSMLLLTAIVWLLWWGVGVWGVNIPVGWGFAIVNFVWWIGIGHAGTFISAILLLARQNWRNSINRFAEAMTLFAVAMAGLFPVLHLGRIQRFYYLFPYPATTGAWPQWRSPLVWDVFAVSTYATVSLLYWYVGLIPDLATLRDSAKHRWSKLLSGIFALGWRGESRQWQRHQTLYLLFAGLATPLVISVHSIVSFDFAAGIVPGWHSTIFPPYFVAGAIFAGFAMVATIIIPVRVVYGLKDLITERHLDNMGKIMLVTGMFVAYGYATEVFFAFFSGDQYEIGVTMNRMVGPYWYIFWGAILCNCTVPQLLWSRTIRVNPVTLFIVSQFINVGMWFERYMIVVVSLHRDFMPTAWGMYAGTRWDWMLYIGTIITFVLLVLLFIRLLPIISIFEIRELLHHAHHDPAHVSEPAENVATSVPEVLLMRGEDVYGMVAEFETSEELEAAVRTVKAAGFEHVNAYMPLPMESLTEAMELPRSKLPHVMLVGGIIGGISGFAFQAWCATIAYPWNIAGKPNFSWPAFIPITFEMTILTAAIFGLTAMFLWNRFPQLYHPISNTPNFERASKDRFFLAIERADAKYDRDQARILLQSFSPVAVSEVPK